MVLATRLAGWGLLVFLATLLLLGFAASAVAPGLVVAVGLLLFGSFSEGVEGGGVEMGKTPIPRSFPLDIIPTPSYGTWIDWATEQFIEGWMTLEEFEAYVDQMLALGDPRWEMLPGGPGPIRVHHSYGVRNYEVERVVWLRSVERVRPSEPAPSLIHLIKTNVPRDQARDPYSFADGSMNPLEPRR